MKISGSVDGDLAAVADEYRAALSADLRRGMQAAADAVQADLRGQVRAAGLGAGLERAWSQRVYPRAGTRTLDPAGLVFSKSTVLHRAFTEGATIAPRGGRYLVIPTREAEALGYGKTRLGRDGGAIPGGQSRRASQYGAAVRALGKANIRVVPLARGRKLVVYRVPDGRGRGKRLGARGRGLSFRRGTDIPIFLMVPVVRLAKRLDFEGTQDRVPGILAAELEAALARG